jgi:hypothetical protein
MSIRSWLDFNNEDRRKYIGYLLKSVYDGLKQDDINKYTDELLKSHVPNKNCIHQTLINLRDNKKINICSNSFDLPHGICNSHNRSVQSKTIRLKYEEMVKELTSKKVEPLKEVETTTKVPPPQIVKQPSPKKSSDPPSIKIPSPVKAQVKAPSPKKVQSTSPVKTTTKSNEPPKPIVKKVIRIEKNKYGNYEHTDTHLVFDPATKSAYGVQHENGDVYSLQKEQINICNKYGWNYILPEARYKHQNKESPKKNVLKESPKKNVLKEPPKIQSTTSLREEVSSKSSSDLKNTSFRGSSLVNKSAETTKSSKILRKDSPYRRTRSPERRRSPERTSRRNKSPPPSRKSRKDEEESDESENSSDYSLSDIEDIESEEESEEESPSPPPRRHRR